MSAKKGLGMFQFYGERGVEAGASWYYNWRTKASDSGSLEFVPMIWGERDNHNQNYQDAKNAASPYLLGFNEPDSCTGGDEAVHMSPQRASDIWPRLQWTGKKLGSPAVASDKKWQWEFMRKVEAPGVKAVDFMAVHYYPDITEPQRAAKELLDLCADTWATYGRKVWLTEFGALNYESSDKVIAFIKLVVPLLENAPFVERYAWFADAGYRGYSGSAIFDHNGHLTKVGEAYRDAK